MAWQQQQSLHSATDAGAAGILIMLEILAIVGTGLLMVRRGSSAAPNPAILSNIQDGSAVWRCLVPALTVLGVSYFAVTAANLWTKTIYALTADFPHGSFTKLDLVHLYQATFLGGMEKGQSAETQLGAGLGSPRPPMERSHSAISFALPVL